MRTEDRCAQALLVGFLGIVLAGCGGSERDADGTGEAIGGAGTTGGVATGGVVDSVSTGGRVTGSGGRGEVVATGGRATASGGAVSSGGSAQSGGAPGIGGTSRGGAGTGGTGTGGTGTGGTGTGGTGTGGTGTGGTGTGGTGTGGTGTGGTGTGGTGTGGLGGGAIGLGGVGESMGGHDGLGGSVIDGLGGVGIGGDTGLGVGGTGEATGGTSDGMGGTSEGTGGTTNSGPCTPSKAAGSNASGSGPHEVIVETNADPGIKEGTIFRPKDLGGTEKYPIFVWGEGGCSLNGLSNATAMAEIASYGYFVIADGSPNGGDSRAMDSSNPAAMGKPLIAYIDWAIAENDKPCSAYYQSLDTSKIAANGFSCGGLMAEGTAGDPRITTWGLNSSGLFGANDAFYKTIHTPVLMVEGGPSDMAYENGQRDFANISALGIPILFFSKDIGHGGDLFGNRGGDFTKIDLAWLNWQLKGDETAAGKGLLVGSGCPYCTDSAWEVKSANLP